MRRLVGLTAIRDLYLPGPSWNPASGSRLDANEELKNLAGLVTLQRLYFSMHFLPNINVRDNGLAYLTKLTKLRDIRLAQCRISAPDLALFADLESLDVSYTTFNDSGMKSLQNLKNLRRLYLRDTLITDEGLQYLENMPHLEELDLYGTKVSDAGLSHLKKLTGLTKLNLLGANVSDESASIFAGFPHLRELNLYRSRDYEHYARQLDFIKGTRRSRCSLQPRNRHRRRQSSRGASGLQSGFRSDNRSPSLLLPAWLIPGPRLIPPLPNG